MVGQFKKNIWIILLKIRNSIVYLKLLWIEKLFVDLIIDVSLFDVFLLSEYREIAGVLLWFGLFREKRLVKTTLCAGG